MHPEAHELLKTIIWDPDDEEAEVNVDVEKSKEIVCGFLRRTASDRVDNPHEMALVTPLFYSLLLVFESISIDEYIEAYKIKTDESTNFHNCKIDIVRMINEAAKVGRKMKELRMEMENEDAS